MIEDPRTLIALQLGLETMSRIEAQAAAEALHRENQALKAQIEAQSKSEPSDAT